MKELILFGKLGIIIAKFQLDLEGDDFFTDFDGRAIVEPLYGLRLDEIKEG